MIRTVLAVDDSKTMRDMVSFTLKNAGFSVVEAVDGKHALKQLNGARFDLIITDVNMPNMDGIALVRNIRRQPIYRSTPILILTTERDDAKKNEGRAAGATGWLVKPFDPGKLVQVVNRVCP